MACKYVNRVSPSHLQQAFSIAVFARKMVSRASARHFLFIEWQIAIPLCCINIRIWICFTSTCFYLNQYHCLPIWMLNVAIDCASSTLPAHLPHSNAHCCQPPEALGLPQTLWVLLLHRLWYALSTVSSLERGYPPRDSLLSEIWSHSINLSLFMQIASPIGKLPDLMLSCSWNQGFCLERLEAVCGKLLRHLKMPCVLASAVRHQSPLRYIYVMALILCLIMWKSDIANAKCLQWVACWEPDIIMALTA